MSETNNTPLVGFFNTYIPPILGNKRFFRQTGSGKTYTMEGVDKDGQRGIISRTISKIFEETSSLVEKVLIVKKYLTPSEIYTLQIILKDK